MVRIHNAQCAFPGYNREAVLAMATVSLLHSTRPTGRSRLAVQNGHKCLVTGNKGTTNETSKNDTSSLSFYYYLCHIRDIGADEI